MDIEKENKKMEAQHARGMLAVELVNDLLKVVSLQQKAFASQTHASLLMLEDKPAQSYQEIKQKSEEATALMREAEMIIKGIRIKVIAAGLEKKNN